MQGLTRVSRPARSRRHGACVARRARPSRLVHRAHQRSPQPRALDDPRVPLELDSRGHVPREQGELSFVLRRARCMSGRGLAACARSRSGPRGRPSARLGSLLCRRAPARAAGRVAAPWRCAWSKLAAALGLRRPPAPGRSGPVGSARLGSAGSAAARHSAPRLGPSPGEAGVSSAAAAGGWWLGWRGLLSVAFREAGSSGCSIGGTQRALRLGQVRRAVAGRQFWAAARRQALRPGGAHGAAVGGSFGRRQAAVL